MKNNLKIKLFADGANLVDMLQMHKNGIVQGFTTNPTLMRKSYIKDYKQFIKSVVNEIPDMPVSFEVISDDIKNMEKEARKIASFGDNIYVKIPVTNTKGEFNSFLIQRLSYDGIKLNVTAILTSNQVNVVTNSLNFCTPSIVSLFAGRIADTGVDPCDTMRTALTMVRKNKNCELLWASSRELYNIIQAQEVGCHIITVTNDILKKLPMLGKDLTELSLDTVKMFRNDSISSGYIL